MKRSFASSNEASEHDFIQNKTSKKGDKQSRSELRSDPRERDEDSDGVEVDVSEKENSDDDADVVDHVNDSIDNGDRNGVEEEEEEEDEDREMQIESHTPQFHSSHAFSASQKVKLNHDNGERTPQKATSSSVASSAASAAASAAADEIHASSHNVQKTKV